MRRVRLAFEVFAMAAVLGFVTAPGLALAPASEATELAPRVCCRICKKGKVCGDSCIARDKKCNKPRGCACDG